MAERYPTERGLPRVFKEDHFSRLDYEYLYGCIVVASNAAPGLCAGETHKPSCVTTHLAFTMLP